MNENFYQDLIGFQNFSDFTNPIHYKELPNDWLVVITDVKGSTKAIENGQYKSVNALGVASIVALLKALKPIEVPYVFGGDGATLCFPHSKLEKVIDCFSSIHDLAEKQFHLEMRTGIVPMQILLKNNKPVFIAKYEASNAYHQAMFKGQGLTFAEALIKKNSKYLIKPNPTIINNLLNGFECRWQEIPSPQEETIALMVQTISNENSSTLYNQIIQKIESIYGNENQYRPLNKDGLNLNINEISNSPEIQIRNHKRTKFTKTLYKISLGLQVIIGRFLMKNGIKLSNGNWGTYKNTLIQNTDFRKFDEVLRMIISGNQNQRMQLRKFLEDLKNKDEIIFGLHSSKNAIMTCMIFDYNENHIHFLDTANGGYAIAAKEMKSQIKINNKK